MNNDFETEYSNALCEFILNMEKLPPVFDHPSINGMTEKLCRILRISRFEVTLSIPVRGGAEKYDVRSGLIFSEENFDKSRTYSLKKLVVDGSKAEYTLYQYTDEPDWTEDERKKIDVLVKTMFVFNGRARVMSIAEKLAFSDLDLGIHNLNYFINQCSKLLSQDMLSDYTCCRFNIKRFSNINRRFGRNGGTEIMRRYVKDLNDILGGNGMVCRIGGDNFIAIFPNSRTEEVKNYLLGTTVSTGVDGLDKITISSRAGYCPITHDCRLVTDIMDRVTSAESIANHNPNLPYVYYDDEIRHRTETSKWIEGLFGDALRDEEFLVYYQPKVDLNDYSVSGAEALCRWKHKGELIQPARFISIFEQTSNICILDFYMLEHICQDIRRWLDAGIPVVKVSAHMSRVNLGSDDLAERIIEIVNRYDIPKEYIEIELKETTTDVDFAELKRVVMELHKEGINTSVDSFGVRYSSLNLIRELPWSVLKIDRSLLPANKEENDGPKTIMIKYVIELARALGLDCIAEGVETKDQAEFLKDNGCFLAQGFYFDKPLPSNIFEERLRSGHNYSGGGIDTGKRNVEFFDELLD